MRDASEGRAMKHEKKSIFDPLPISFWVAFWGGIVFTALALITTGDSVTLLLLLALTYEAYAYYRLYSFQGSAL
jgi:hypothetical protein